MGYKEIKFNVINSNYVPLFDLSQPAIYEKKVSSLHGIRIEMLLYKTFFTSTETIANVFGGGLFFCMAWKNGNFCNALWAKYTKLSISRCRVSSSEI